MYDMVLRCIRYKLQGSGHTHTATELAGIVPRNNLQECVVIASMGIMYHKSKSASGADQSWWCQSPLSQVFYRDT